jgi:hypothetical protein
VSPREPPTTSTVPARVLVLVGAAARDRARISAVTRRCSVSDVLEPMSATTTSPAGKRPARPRAPTFGACIVTVTVASPHAPATSPVEAFTPEGRSTATTGCRCVDRRDRARRILARLAVEPGAEERVDDDVRLLDRASSDVRAACRRLEHSRAIRPSPPFAPPPQTRRTAARRGSDASPPRPTARPARAISSSTSWPASARFISSAV